MKNNKVFIVLVTICIFLLGALSFYLIYEVTDEKLESKIEPDNEKIEENPVNKEEHFDFTLDDEEEKMLNVLANYAFMNNINGKFSENLIKDSLITYIELNKDKTALNEVVYQYKVEDDEIEEFIELAGYKNKNLDEVVNPEGASILYKVNKIEDDYIFEISGHGLSSYKVEKTNTEVKNNKLVVTYDAKCSEELGISKIGTLEITLAYNDDFYIENIKSTPDGKEHYCY